MVSTIDLFFGFLKQYVASTCIIWVPSSVDELKEESIVKMTLSFFKYIELFESFKSFIGLHSCHQSSTVLPAETDSPVTEIIENVNINDIKNTLQLFILMISPPQYTDHLFMKSIVWDADQ